MVTGAFSSETEKPTNMAKKEKKQKRNFYNKIGEKKHHACNTIGYGSIKNCQILYAYSVALALGDCMRTRNMNEPIFSTHVITRIPQGINLSL